LTQTEIEKLSQETKIAVDEATKFATASPFPDSDEALEDVYAP